MSKPLPDTPGGRRAPEAAASSRSVPPESLPAQANPYFEIRHGRGGAELHVTDRADKDERFVAAFLTLVFGGFAAGLACAALAAPSENSTTRALFGCGAAASLLAVPAVLWMVLLAPRDPEHRRPLAVRDGAFRRGELLLCPVDEITAVRLHWEPGEDSEGDYTVQVVTAAGPVVLPVPYYGAVRGRENALLLARDLAAVLGRPVLDEIGAGPVPSGVARSASDGIRTAGGNLPVEG
jgi:hypothetical protein